MEPVSNKSTNALARVSLLSDAKEVEAARAGSPLLQSVLGSKLARPWLATGASGSPLDPLARRSMERRFSHHFGAVRVFADSNAAESARALDAEAFTLGPNIVFGERQYSPQTRSGESVLAHELTHVMQHERDSVIQILRKGVTAMRKPPNS